jgi:glucose-1-phosphate thymidylyltransferase
VAEFDVEGRVIGFEEKPAKPKSDRIPIGVYLFRSSVFEVLGALKPSARGEFEITDVLNEYVRRGSLASWDYGGEWQDAGTIESLLLAGSFVAPHAAGLPIRSRHEDDVEAEDVNPSGAQP